MPAKFSLLVVEDDIQARKNLVHILKRNEQYEVTAAASGVEALQLIRSKSFDLVLTDLRMEKVDGMEVLTEVRRISPATEVVMLTAFASLDSAIEAMRRGAFHYIAKPYKIDEVRTLVGRALEQAGLKKELALLKQDLAARDGVASIVGKHPRIKELIRLVVQVAPTDSSVLIVGETGTGKELFARFLHQASKRAEKRFVAFNCAAFSEHLLVSELFGHEKGSFTGAETTKAGLFEAADGGTVFLDEIGDMPLEMQAKVLRVLQEKELTRVGSTKPIPVDVRLVAATNQDLDVLVEKKLFRSDLLYRINVVRLALPPLREHPEDIPLLAQHFMEKHARRQEKEIHEISSGAMLALESYDFAGNVRELENIIERAVTLKQGGRLEVSDLPREVTGAAEAAYSMDEQGRMPTLEEKECEYIKLVLKHTKGNKTQAAEILGIDRVSLWRKIKKAGLES